MSKSITIRDVARLAGVSAATVSAVINGKGGVSPKLVERVQTAIAAVDYHPDHLARSLKVRRSHTVGIVLADISNPFYTELILGVESAARARQYSVILCNSNEDKAIERQNLSMLFARRVDGVILATTDTQVAQDRLALRQFPLVLVDRIPPGFTGSAVITDNREAACEATRHLIELRHRRIAIITGRLSLSSGIDRLEGFRSAMEEARLPIRREYVLSGDFQLESGYRRGLELMRLSEPPTAIFCCNNKMTLGLMRALAELRIPCPERVSVVGFDDFDWADAFRPRLTTVAQQTFEMGRKAVEQLMRKIESPNTELDEILTSLHAQLHIRESTAPPADEGSKLGN